MRAIKKLKVMGNGFGMIPVGGSYLVQSVPAELNMDHTVVLQLAEVNLSFHLLSLYCVAASSVIMLNDLSKMSQNTDCEIKEGHCLFFLVSSCQHHAWIQNMLL